MKTVYLIRHAKSSWEDMSLRDIDRPLNKRGFRDAPFMANLLKGKGAEPDAFISSPANRAFTTATYFVKAFGLAPKDIIVNKMIYEAYGSDVINIIRGLDDKLNSVCIFGHNPTFTSLANHFSKKEYIPNVPTCGIVKIEATIDSWTAFSEEKAQRSAFHYPKQYFK